MRPLATAGGRYALFGSSIDDSPSPAMLGAAFGSSGLRAEYELRTAHRGEAARVVAEVREELAGANITMPLKTEVAALVPLVGGAAQAGAVNTLWWRGDELVGSLTDIEGVKRPLGAAHYKGGGGALVIGAGGAARAAAIALAQGGAVVHIAARRLEAAEEVLDNLTGASRGTAIPLAEQGVLADLFVDLGVILQATPVGRQNEAHLLPWAAAPADAIAFEMITRPRQTPFIREAEQRGLRVIEGWQMLVAQGAASFELWTGLTADLEAMSQAASLAASKA